MIDFQLPFGAREQTPKRIIVHCMAEFLEGGERDIYASYFLEKLGLSAHILVTPSGQLIRCRKDEQGAYHAKGFNTNSLGIEFLVPGVHNYASFLDAINEPYLSEVQLNAGIAQVRKWLDIWHIDSIDRHSDLSPDRKKDPGKGFPWDEFLNTVR